MEGIVIHVRDVRSIVPIGYRICTKCDKLLRDIDYVRETPTHRKYGMKESYSHVICSKENNAPKQ